MKLVLTHDTALQLMRSHRELGHGTACPSRIRTLDDCVHSLRQIESFALPFLVDNSKVIHVLVPSRLAIGRSKHHVCHVMMGDVPCGAFYQAENRVYSATPELLFVQQASELPLVNLILFGLEICGTYTLLAAGESGFYHCPAATTKAQLASFVARAKGMRGAATALRALKWIVNGSNSPMESALMLLFCLPVCKGGYGFPLPDMNPKVSLGQHASRMLQQDTIRCDLHWLSKRVAVEYNSTQEHLNPVAAARDAQRFNALGYDDMAVIAVTPRMIAVPAQFDSVARRLAQALGKRMGPQVYVLSQARSELRFQLFPWLRDYPGAQFF